MCIRDRVQRHRPPSWLFSMSRLCSPQTVYSRPPPSTWSLHMLACADFSLTTIGPACPTTWRPPNRGETVFCFRCALYAFWDLSPPLPAASFRSGYRTMVILCLRVCLVCVRFRSPSFVQAAEPWRYRIFWVRSACTPPFTTADSVCLHSFRLSNRGCYVILVAFVLY